MRQKRFLCLKGIVFAWLFTILLAAGGQHVCFAAEENVPQQTVYDDAALLTPEEIETLESELDAAGEKTGSLKSGGFKKEIEEIFFINNSNVYSYKA